MTRFFLHYLVLPIALVLAAGTYAFFIYHPELQHNLGSVLTDFIAFVACMTVLALWLFAWEWRESSRTFELNRRQIVTDLLFSMASITVVGVGHLFVLSIPEEALFGRLVPVFDLPVVVQILLVILIHDLILYWWHRIQHESGDSFVWRIHRPHHTPQRLTVLMGGRNHALDAMALVASLALTRTLGFSDESMYWGMWYPAAVGAIHHANLDLRLGIFNYVLPGPEIHRIHHSVVIEDALNYAPSVPLWDWVFGTMMPLSDPHEVDYGTPVGDDRNDTIVTAHVYPFQLLVKEKQTGKLKPDYEPSSS
ncbi:MAG: sterol desaturase family protein [Bacteroidota bacterium]